MTDWHVTVEYDKAITEDQAEAIVARGDYPTVTVDRDRGRTAISFGVTASTVRQAMDAAARTARDLTAGTDAGAAVKLRILTEADLADELERPTIPPLVDSTGAREILGGITQQRLSELAQTHPDFPEPIERFAGGRAVWVRAAVEGFAKRWDRRPGRPRKASPPTISSATTTAAAVGRSWWAPPRRGSSRTCPTTPARRRPTT